MNATIGPVAVLPSDGLPRPDEVSERTQRLVDDEVRNLVATAHDDVTRLLTQHRHQLDSLAEALLEHETLDQADAYAAAKIDTHPAASQGAVAVAAQTVTARQIGSNS
jgi:cell division protease FtsH